MTDLEILKWVYEMTQAEMPLGEYAAVTHYDHPQKQEWNCTGCKGKGWSHWPQWKLDFDHMPGCKWVALKDRVLSTAASSYGEKGSQ
jgi:hypothetical protein